MKEPEHISQIIGRAMDEISEYYFGEKRSVALANKTCLKCKKKIEGRNKTKSEWREYMLVGICGVCQSEVTEK